MLAARVVGMLDEDWALAAAKFLVIGSLLAAPFIVVDCWLLMPAAIEGIAVLLLLLRFALTGTGRWPSQA